MSSVLEAPTPSLQALRDRLAAGQSAWPPTAAVLHKVALDEAEVAPLLAVATSVTSAIALLDLILAERKARQREADSVELVWSGPEQGTTETRETSVVLRELFLMAKRSVLVATFVVYDGDFVFSDLARRFDGGLDVRFVLHAESDSDPIRSRERCLETFRRKWPGEHLPPIWIDPRTTRHASRKTSMHAKFVVVDDEVVLLTSANFTEAAQERNVEAGALIRQPIIAARLRRHVDSLIAHGLLEQITGSRA